MSDFKYNGFKLGKTRTTISVSPDMHLLIRLLANKDNISVIEEVQRLLASAIKLRRDGGKA